jgi:hypothetical protein
MRELARIKKEREAEQAKLEEEKLRAEAASNANSVLRSNPLVNAAGTAPTIGDDATVKRKWYDETIFKNQAKEDTQTKKAAKRFINDTIRSDFHRFVFESVFVEKLLRVTMFVQKFPGQIHKIRLGLIAHTNNETRTHHNNSLISNIRFVSFRFTLRADVPATLTSIATRARVTLFVASQFHRRRRRRRQLSQLENLSLLDNLSKQ